MKRIKLFLKGVCMGVSDVIPGVSGGTMALILGIYAELVDTIKGLHLRWLPSVWRWARGGFRREDGREVIEAWRQMNLVFLFILGAGVAGAIAVGGMVVPGLLDTHPEVMQALFFGLILASIGIPFRMITLRTTKTRLIVGAMAIIGLGVGWMATSPDRMYEVGMTWVEVEAGPEDTLESINRRGPSALPAEQVYLAEENAALRKAIEEATAPANLDPLGGEVVDDAVAAEDNSERYANLEVPQGVVVLVPQPAPWYVFVAGLIAICAMILPGISGAYILLIMGAYYFVLNSLRAVLSGLTDFAIPAPAVIAVLLFMLGALIGILSFARVMSYLLRRFRPATVGLLVGLMIGCLRGIWPFRQMVDGRLVNVMPAAIDATVISAGVAAGIGAAAVLILSYAGRRRVGGSTEPTETEH